MATYPQTTSAHPAAFPPSAGAPRTPPLESGDRLPREEFERRWTAMPNLKRAELIGGVVYLQAPISNAHGQPHALLAAWFVTYSAATPGALISATPSVRLDDGNMPQPDVCLRISPECGGQTRNSVDDYIEGAPELVAEVAASSAGRDLHMKKEMYRTHGVREYIVLRVYDKALDWFILQDGQYEPLPPDADGLFRSRAFPGLWLDAAALLASDAAAMLVRLQAGLASAEHTAFAARLAAAGKKA